MQLFFLKEYTTFEFLFSYLSERQSTSAHDPISEMPATGKGWGPSWAKSEPGASGTSSGPPMWMEGPQVLEPSPTD